MYEPSVVFWADVNISPTNPSAPCQESELSHAQFPQRLPPLPALDETYDRVLSLCTSQRTRAVANLWFDFHAQRGAAAFFSAPHLFVSVQFATIHRILCASETPLGVVKATAVGAPRIGHEIIKDEAVAQDAIKSRRLQYLMRFGRNEIIPINPWVKWQLHRLLMQATSPEHRLTPSLDNLARISRPLLYLYSNGGRTPGRGLELLTELCCRRLAQCDLREPLTLDPVPNIPPQRLPLANKIWGIPHPFLGVILHDEIHRDDFLELDTLPIVLAELNPHHKYSDNRKLGRDPEDLFSHDVELHGHFLTRFSELRGLSGQRLLAAINRRARFAEAFEEKFPRGSRYREAASTIRFGFHHEGWFGHLFGSQFFEEKHKGTWRLTQRHTGETLPMNQYIAHLFSNDGPWLEDRPEPRHSLEWFEMFRFMPKKVSEEFLTAVGKSLIPRCVPEDLGKIPNSRQIAQLLPHYWELVRSVAD